MVCDDEFSREFPILVLMPLVDLACTAVFDLFMDGILLTFPVHCSTKSFFKSSVSRVL